MTDAAVRYVRQVEVVWRLAPDRVLVRRPWPKDGQDEAADLLGLAALIWIALDEPGTVTDLVERLADAGDATEGVVSADVTDTLDQLLATGWVELAQP